VRSSDAERRAEGRKVRFGGLRTPDGFLFELTGGRLCLDLANTLDSRPTPEPLELLPRYEDLVSWGVQAGAVDEAVARGLRRHAGSRPRAAARALAKARRGREAIFAIFSAVARGQAPPSAAMAELNALLPAALSARRVAERGSGYAWEWTEGDPPELDRVVWPALVSAAELLTSLTSGELGRVRVCAGEGCAWLFLDRSRNGSRRWCDMTVCGNRTKARRHYAKSKGRGVRRPA